MRFNDCGGDLMASWTRLGRFFAVLGCLGSATTGLAFADLPLIAVPDNAVPVSRLNQRTEGPERLVAVLREALAFYPTLKVKRGELDAAQFEVEGAEWGRYPTLRGQARGLSNALGGGSATQLTLQQPLWTGGRITGQIRKSEAGVAASRSAMGGTELEVLTKTASAYFDRLRLEARLESALSNEVEHQRLLDIIQRRVAAEVSPVADQTQAAARKHQATTERIQIERQLADAKSRLEQLVGRPVAALTTPRITLDSAGLARLRAAALAYSPEYKRLQAEIERADAEAELARASVMPTLYIAHEMNIGTLLSGQERNFTYLGLEANSGAGLSSLSTIKAAAARKQAARDQLRAYEQELLQQMDSFWAEVVALEGQLAPVQDILLGSDAIVNSYLRQFVVGRKNWLDVLNAQREKAQTYASLADIEANLLLGKLRLRLLAGEITAQNLDALNGS